MASSVDVKKIRTELVNKPQTDLHSSTEISKNKKKKMKKKSSILGRKSQYFWKVEPKLHLVADWMRNGATENEVYKKLGVSHTTWSLYKREHPPLLEALKTRVEADAQVEAALFKNATGFSYEEVTTITRYSESGGLTEETKIIVKYKEPDTTAQAIWLNNRRKENWKQRQRDNEANGNDAELDPITKSILNHVNGKSNADE